MQTKADNLEKIITKQMQDSGAALPVIQEFLRRVRRVASGAVDEVVWEDIGELEKKDMVSLDSLASQVSLEDNSSYEAVQKHLSSIAVIKLNGGLGTSMGLKKAKSLIPVRGEKNFLDIVCCQAEAVRKKYNVQLPVFFMNSFNTHKDTLEIQSVTEINQKAEGKLPSAFLQNQVPRIYQDSLLPLEQAEFGRDAWCPPGHGDVFFALKSSGLLDRLFNMGYRTVFISNGDNLGAVVDPHILEYFHREKLEWISEVTAKTSSDKKGGILFRRKKRESVKRENGKKENGKREEKREDDAGNIELLETAQVPDKHKKDFEDISRFSFFNVNNLWINIEALDAKLKSASLNLALIQNPKVISGRRVLQLETAMGAGISCFEKSRVVLVPRNRFSPVKTCADLLVRRSDAYVLNLKDSALIPNGERPPPTVLLGPDYDSLQNFEKLFSVVPSLKELVSLEVKGRLLFVIPVSLKGKVSFCVRGEEQKALSQLNRKEFENESIEI